VVNDSADVRSSGRSFKVGGPATGKAQLSTVDDDMCERAKVNPGARQC